MRRTLPVVAALVLAACAHHDKVQRIRPEMGLRQLIGPADVGYPTGRMDVQYALAVKNRSSEPITLRRIDIQSVGGGSYTLRRDNYYFTETINPDQVAEVTFWVHAIARGGAFGHGTSEPVTVRGIVFFESPSGPFQQIFQRDLEQFPGSGRQ